MGLMQRTKGFVSVISGAESLGTIDRLEVYLCYLGILVIFYLRVSVSCCLG